MVYQGKKVLVLGAGRSGVASARFLASHGAVVALHDRKSVEKWSDEARELKTAVGVGLIDGDIPSWLLDQIELVVISPGVPTNSIPARYVDRKDGEVIGEVELACRHLMGDLVGITGSNGKTTTTALIGEIFKDAKFHTQVGGNIGTPLLSLCETSTDNSWTVAELSSFQLETIVTMRPHIALCLNVTPNHLDRYDSFLDYALAKHRIFMNQTADDFAILNADNEITREWASGLRGQVRTFSIEREPAIGAFLRGGSLFYRDGETERLLTTRDKIFLPGSHNVENVLAAFITGISAGIEIESIAETVRNFRGVEHRIEFVAEHNGVRYYNDSKATSVDAAVKAVEALASDDGKIVLILGGLGKNAPYSPLAGLVERYVRELILIGDDAKNIELQLTGTSPITRVSSMEEAVDAAKEAAINGDVVLLAPACASFDMFDSFEHRGEVFKEAVRAATTLVSKA